MIIKTENDAKCSVHSKHQKQAWKFWDSMTITSFILGPGLLLAVGFRNSVSWHLQNFWRASGFFWQRQWENLHLVLGGNEWMIFFLAVTIVPSLVFWSFNGIMMMADITGKPTFITRYRIQMGKNDPVDRAKLHNAISTVLFNQFFISLPMAMLMLPILKWRGEPCSLSLPTFHWFLLELAVCGLVEEILFYYSHRLVHHPLLYKHIHKKHHEWTAPVGIVSLYAHPVEHVISNMLPVVTGPVLLGSHITSVMAWFSLALLATSVSHCGYHLPFLPSPEFHDFHHLKFNQCYGVLGVLDRLHGTDRVFKQTKAYKRHFILLSFTPTSESIPESSKKPE
ncbi:fatty acid hydroxylase domain-containing protein 2 [Eublepharis macularius]|uniref:Fatty acid hydroxylase domain-containing protein 2 n=1 Tax=Eublepharis macularius TaxID=481883 RepID=A0AA97KXQ8_EUBMA|nr:fatty acid hydroxylase domain-containing protein 2 [Eublepharis macularius]XP_054834092.1 fatty acid hydroxylase domain-containing protein 2 [Eublepharis macularius]XP_054834093.1 fatty acid hydroxylase domain-containing protein 2 [Eublepharis macularius]